MGKIRILSPDVIAKIAAGEVIERPASVVKELVENALDAGSTEIKIEAEAGGRRLIRVTDNGDGMTAEDARLAVERHATSKIEDAEDLSAIQTFGFRGEALAAIGAVSRMTIVTRGDDATVEQIVKQLNKLTDTMKVQDFREGEYVDRELVLVKVAVDSETRAEVMQITDIFRAKIVDVQPKSLTVEITGDEGKVEKFLELMKTFGVMDLTRTGKVAMARK